MNLKAFLNDLFSEQVEVRNPMSDADIALLQTTWGKPPIKNDVKMTKADVAVLETIWGKPAAKHKKAK